MELTSRCRTTKLRNGTFDLVLSVYELTETPNDYGSYLTIKACAMVNYPNRSRAQYHARKWRRALAQPGGREAFCGAHYPDAIDPNKYFFVTAYFTKFDYETGGKSRGVWGGKLDALPHGYR